MLDGERGRKLGRLELVAYDQPVEPQHQIVRDARTTVGYADPQQLSALELGIDGRACLLVLAHVAAQRPALAFYRRRRVSPAGVDRLVRILT